MEQIVREQIARLSEQRKDLIYSLYEIDVNLLNYSLKVNELTVQISNIDMQINNYLIMVKDIELIKLQNELTIKTQTK